MKKLLYIHGFGSKFDPENAKVVTLAEHFEIVGVDIDYTEKPEVNLAKVEALIKEHNIDGLTGTSMGGWLSIVSSGRFSLPAVALNPAFDPHASLARHIGKGVDFTGKAYDMTQDTVNAYADYGLGTAPVKVPCLTFHGTADDVIDPIAANACLNARGHETHLIPGVEHRFSDLAPILDQILAYFKQALK